jgi:hypothetical protein
LQPLEANTAPATANVSFAAAPLRLCAMGATPFSVDL